MTPRDRADVLLQATIWRLRWEADNPHLRQIFIDPQDFPPEVCKKMASELFEVWFPLWQNQKALNGRLRALGSTEKLPDADIKGISVWAVTLGAMGGTAKHQDMMQLWTYLVEAFPFIDQSMAALMKRQEVQRKLGYTSDLMLGLDVEQVVTQARHMPTCVAHAMGLPF
jgi:hypothetical protein